MHTAPPSAPSATAIASAVSRNPELMRQMSGNPGYSLGRSPRRAMPLGQTNRHATPWVVQAPFHLDCPYGIATTDSRFADAQADKAALAAVAHTAGTAPAAPAAGMSSARSRASKELPSLRRELNQGALP